MRLHVSNKPTSHIQKRFGHNCFAGWSVTQFQSVCLACEALCSSLSTNSLKALLGAGEMAQWLRALTAPPEDLGSIPSTHMAAHSCL